MLISSPCLPVSLFSCLPAVALDIPARHAAPLRLGGCLEIRGDAEITPDDDYSFADRFGAKYQANLRDHDRPGDRRVIVTIKPTRVNAVDMRG